MRVLRLTAAAGVAVLALGALAEIAAARAASGSNDTDGVQTGRASWYGQRHHGRLTANGETFDQDGFTAAHPDLPFGTWVKVTLLASRRSVLVRINDRFPMHRGRIIDLSRAAAREIGMMRRGTGRVRIEVVDQAASSVASR